MVFRKLTAIAVVFSLLLGISGCGKTQETRTTVTVSEVTHSIFYAPQYAAIELGYFEEEGIDIELVNAGGSDKVMTAVLTGAADVGLAGAETCVYVHLEGKEDAPRVFGQLTCCDGSFLLGREEDDDFQWESLAGSTILPGRRGGMPYMCLLYALKQHGLTVGEDVFFNDTIQFDAMVGAFSAGEGDYVTAFEPSASAVVAEGKGVILASVGEASGSVPYTAYFAGEAFLEDQPELAEAFLRAVAKGQRFVAEHTAAEVAEAIAPSFPDTDLAVIEQVVARYQSIGAYAATPVMTEESFTRLLDIIAGAGEMDADAEIAFSEVIETALAEKVK